LEGFLKKYLGKILIIVLPIVASLILLYPTWNASKLEEKENSAKARAVKAKNSVDSLAIMDNFYKLYGEDLADAKKSRLKLGLDLRGGMYVTMEVDIVKLIQESAVSESVDDIFNEVINKTIEDQKNSEDVVIDLFLKNFTAIARPKGKTLLNYFETLDYKDVSEEAIIKKLHDNADQAIDQAQEVIRQRIDQYGVSEPNINKSGSRRIVLELPGVQNRNEMMSLLQTTARLEFNLVRNNETIIKAFSKIDKHLSNIEKKRKGMSVTDEVSDTTAADSAMIAANDTSNVKMDSNTTIVDTARNDSDVAMADSNKKDTSKKDPNNPYDGLSDEEAAKRYKEDHPFTTLFVTYYHQGTDENAQIQQFGYIGNEIPEGEYSFRIPKESMAKFNLLLAKDDIKTFLPVDLSINIDAKPDRQAMKQNIEIYNFYVLKKDPELTGEVITDAKATFDPTTNAPVVSMQMNADGAESWARITGANLKKRIAIVLDGRVYSAPVVQAKIVGGNSQISGMANTDEAHLLEIVLKSGALKAPVQIIEERIVGPSLGEDSIRNGLYASIGAAILVILFMLMYYNTAGSIADIAVIINVMLILAVLAALGGTLTLPGIAGIILTMGMAVDANVLIFERIREELLKGRTIRAAIDEGFKKAMSAILDSNITTFLTGVVLYYFGSGPIQGFALTLIIGIIGTLFTAILVSKTMIELLIARNGIMSFGQSKVKSI
jgi:preprotein translocase subunit SecD